MVIGDNCPTRNMLAEMGHLVFLYIFRLYGDKRFDIDTRYIMEMKHLEARRRFNCTHKS